MDPEDGNILARKVGPLPLWAWGLAGGVVLWFLLGRGRGASVVNVPAAEQPEATAEQQQAEQLLAQQQAERAKLQSGIEALQYQVIEQQLRQQLAIETGLATKFSNLKPSRFKCAKGRTTVDPQTGQIYCRQEQSGGFFSGLNLNTLFGNLSNVFKPTGGVILQ